MDHEIDKQEPSGKEGGEMSERKYREPTEADIGKLIEVSNQGSRVEYRTWKQETLTKIVWVSNYPFRTSSRQDFRYARIEVQGE
jgi:hypothetical protein